MNFIQSFPDMERATFGARGPTMGLPAMRELLARLGDPQKGTPTIHVAGSKGKGSTSTFIASILQAAGKRTALFTSPHLHDYTERFAFNLEAISDVTFARGLEEIKERIEQEQSAGNISISTFGVLTALFFHLVKTAPEPIDWQIVEVGLGGRYDVTNVFDTKEAAVITPISLEHVEILGKTQTEIAANKAGIVMPHCLTVLAPQKDQGAKTAVSRVCHEMDSELIDVGKKFKIKPTGQDSMGQTFTLEGLQNTLDLRINLLGAHQMTNAATAAATIIGLRNRGALQISDDQIVRGLAKCHVPGRLEILQSAAGDKPLVVADGAHNHESAAALSQSLQQFFNAKNVIFVLGVNNDKNISAIWRELSSLSKVVIATRSSNARSMDPGQILDLISVFEAENPSHITTTSVAEALEKALSIAQKDDVVCVTGSLYVVAEARDYMLKENASSSARKYSRD